MEHDAENARAAGTPGPWKAMRSKQWRAGDLLSLWLKADLYEVGEATGAERGVAFVFDGKGRGASDSRLIAAAPDLLAALRELVAEADEHPGWEGHEHADSLGFGMALAALEKVEAKP